MKTAIFASAALCAALLPSFANMAPRIQGECENIHAHEPRVIYEVSGSTLSGTIDRILTVYSDGALRLASAAPNESGTCVTKQVQPETASKLYQALANAGAQSLCDDSILVIDMPLHTVTTLRGTTDMAGRTFSYWSTDGAYGTVNTLLENFIGDQFPGQ